MGQNQNFFLVSGQITSIKQGNMAVKAQHREVNLYDHHIFYYIFLIFFFYYHIVQSIVSPRSYM